VAKRCQFAFLVRIQFPFFRSSFRRPRSTPTNVMAEVSLALGKYHEAIAKYKKSVDLDPNNAVVYNNWGSALKKLGHNTEAERKFSKYREVQ